MGLRINQNIAALNAYRNVSQTDTQLSKSLEKLSSGFRINRAADDASGLVKSEALRSEVRGGQVAIRNAQDGVSFVQTAEGALNEVHAILQRMRDLAVDASNTATTDGTAQQEEIDQLVEELTGIGNRSTFAGQSVFGDYSTNALTFHVGSGTGSNHELSVQLDLRLDVSGTNGVFSVDLSAVDVTTDADGAIGNIDSAISDVSSARGTLGATQNRLEHVVANLSVAVENLSASESRIRDTDMALEMVGFTRQQIMMQAGTAMLAQANSSSSGVLSLLR